MTCVKHKVSGGSVAEHFKQAISVSYEPKGLVCDRKEQVSVANARSECVSQLQSPDLARDTRAYLVRVSSLTRRRGSRQYYIQCRCCSQPPAYRKVIFGTFEIKNALSSNQLLH